MFKNFWNAMFGAPAPATEKPKTLPLEGKSTPDIREGGWNVLGNTTRKNAGEIWRTLSNPELEALYAKQDIVYSCIRVLQSAACEAPLKIGMETPKGWMDLPNHPLLSLLKNPNPKMSYAEFLAHYIIHLESTGISYVWKWRNSGDEIVQLYPLPTSWVTPKRNAKGELSGYEVWQGQNEPVFVEQRDMFFQLYPDPQNIFLPLSPLSAAIRNTQMEEERQDYMLEMLVNNRAPGLIFKQPEGWSLEQKEEVRNLIGGSGRGNRGRALFLEGIDADIDIKAAMADFDWPGLTNLSETRICSVIGVYPILVGLRSGLESSTYSNMEQALKAFFQRTMVPKWKLMDAVLTRGLLHSEGEPDTVEIYHDIESVQALQEDKDKLTDRTIKLWTSGAITRNQMNERLGLPLLSPELGDVRAMPMNLIEIPAGQKPVAPPKDDGKGYAE